MRPLSALELIEAWDDAPAPGSAPKTALPPHRRLEPLLACALDGRDIGCDTLGRRNQRLIALRRLLCGAIEFEAVARCDCGAENEIDIPWRDIETAPTPGPDTRVTVEVGGQVVVARPPTMSDLNAISGGRDVDARRVLLARCTTAANDGDDEPLLAALAERFEAIDPAADIRLSVTCAECHTPMLVSVDLAAFVYRDVTRLVAGLLGEVDCLARAYGWSEAEILALPAGRRRRYFAMLSGDTFGASA